MIRSEPRWGCLCYFSINLKKGIITFDKTIDVKANDEAFSAINCLLSPGHSSA